MSALLSLAVRAAAVCAFLLALHPFLSAQPALTTDQAAKLIRRARDTRNPADYQQAEDAANKVLSADPENFDAQRYRAMALLGSDDPAAALTVASKLNKRAPDDIGIWALLSEIHAALGSYDEAERCAQWVLDLRRNSPLGFIGAAQLREVFGEDDGADEFYTEALRRTALSDGEQRSWLMVQSARTQLRLENPRRAGALLDEAEKLFPGSLQVLALRGRLAFTRKDYAAAAATFAKLSEAVPTGPHLYAYAEALDQAGRHEEAASAWERFAANPAGAGPLLVLYYADQTKDAARALTLATKQNAARRDVATLDAYAWALFRNGRFAEAKVQIDKVLATGAREARYMCHAARIAEQAGGSEAAGKYAAEGGCEAAP